MADAPPFSRPPLRTVTVSAAVVHVFEVPGAGPEGELVRGFGDEWTKFHSFCEQDLRSAGEELFDLLPDALCGEERTMLDLGCGSGRWTRLLADRFGRIEAVDPSSAIHKAASVHAELPHVRWVQAMAEELPYPDSTFDLVICIGVLHHVRDPLRALREVVRTLRPGGRCYLYMYYGLEERGWAFRAMHGLSELLRRVVYPLPRWVKHPLCECIALLVYLPIVCVVRLIKAMGAGWWQQLPLAYYHNKSYRVMRSDALDRFGTAYERRSTREEIRTLLSAAGLQDIRFSERPPYWHCIATRTEHGAQ